MKLRLAFGLIVTFMIFTLIWIITGPDHEPPKGKNILGMSDRELFFKLFDAGFEVGLRELRELIRERNFEYFVTGVRWERTQNNRGNEVYVITVGVNRTIWDLLSEQEKLTVVQQLYRAVRPMFEKVENMASEKGYAYEGSLLIVSDGKTPLATFGSKTPPVLHDGSSAETTIGKGSPNKERSEVYQYKDGNGVTHFTNTPRKAPMPHN